jgi:hypothetical protein
MTIPQKDLNLLTELWHRSTNRLNGLIDDEFKLAQDEAYNICKATMKPELDEITAERDRLREVNAEMLEAIQWALDDAVDGVIRDAGVSKLRAVLAGHSVYEDEPAAYMCEDGLMAAGAKVYDLLKKATPAKAAKYTIPLYRRRALIAKHSADKQEPKA